ncbi:MAG: glycyl-radical enzyme activating protein [Peptococcaceae bacterium]|jgi:pyruvate formate lyase activating enzyme|nr:glycyl-radical enzyme activating protein [Peptococcaceae bacterium]MDH7525753.1 glycyl-radical enzyme activating protein [Peptococcaceae bacterium]
MINIWKVDFAAVHDGPGIRTSVYLKGCRLRCLWCSNPEGQTSKPDLVYRQVRCIGCGFCEEKCPAGAIQLKKDCGLRQPELRVERGKCNLCGECVRACPSKALEIWGENWQISDAIKIIEKNRLLYRKTGGGVTFTGGDPLCQGEALLVLLQYCRKNGIHTAMETSAYGNGEIFEKVLEEVDWLFIDIKHMDPEEHLKITGKGNDLILENLKRASYVLGRRGRDLVVRMVVVPGLNDGENIYRAAEFLRSLPYLKGVELLPYHRYGMSKYDQLERVYRLPELLPPSAELMDRSKAAIISAGLQVLP